MGEAKKRGTYAERKKKATAVCHAQILVTAGEKGLEISLEAVNEPDNPAVMFSKWVCEHGEELMAQMVKDEARHRIVQQAPKLVGADGKRLN